MIIIMANLKEITWKQSEYGSFIAYCGSQRIGYVKSNYTNPKRFYPSVFNDLVKFKIDEYNNVDEAKKAVELAFNQIVSKFVQDNKVILKSYKDDSEHNFGDKALLPLIDGWTIVEIRDKDGHGGWIFLNGAYGTSSVKFNQFKRPFDEHGNILPIEMWDKVCNELNKKERIVLLNN